MRVATPLRKLVMQTRCNALAWNPMEAFHFTAANEDCCLYTFDMRRLKSALTVHKVDVQMGSGSLRSRSSAINTQEN
jgi:DDB1- and CUL4-associated factor 13